MKLINYFTISENVKNGLWAMEQKRKEQNNYRERQRVAKLNKLGFISDKLSTGFTQSKLTTKRNPFQDMWWIAKCNKLAFASKLFRKTGESKFTFCKSLRGSLAIIRFINHMTEFKTKLQTINHTTRLLRYINSIMTPEKRAFINEKYKGLFKSLEDQKLRPRNVFR